MAEPVTGRCACGLIRYSAQNSALWAMHCHCESCRRVTGSAFTSFLGYGRGQVTWVGNLAHRNSSPGVTRSFCKDCGTPLSYRSTRWPGEVHLYAATLDQPERYKPTAHVFWAERLPWLQVSDDLPKHEDSAP